MDVNMMIHFCYADDIGGMVGKSSCLDILTCRGRFCLLLWEITRFKTRVHRVRKSGTQSCKSLSLPPLKFQLRNDGVPTHWRTPLWCHNSGLWPNSAVSTPQKHYATAPTSLELTANQIPMELSPFKSLGLEHRQTVAISPALLWNWPYVLRLTSHCRRHFSPVGTILSSSLCNLCPLFCVLMFLVNPVRFLNLTWCCTWQVLQQVCNMTHTCQFSSELRVGLRRPNYIAISIGLIFL